MLLLHIYLLISLLIIYYNRCIFLIFYERLETEKKSFVMGLGPFLCERLDSTTIRRRFSTIYKTP